MSLFRSKRIGRAYGVSQIFQDKAQFIQHSSFKKLPLREILYERLMSLADFLIKSST